MSEREVALRALEAAIGREVGQHIHDGVVDAMEKRLRASDRAMSKISYAKDRMEKNLERARATRLATQDKLHLAIRELREQGLELRKLRHDRDMLLGFTAMVAEDAGPFAAAARRALGLLDAEETP